MSIRKFLALGILAGGSLAAGLAQAHEVWAWPADGARPLPVHRPAPLYAPPVRDWHPTRWDVDGDGIPNRLDRFDDRRIDRDHDGIPDRFDRVDNRRWNARHWHDRRWHDRDRDGTPDWRDDDRDDAPHRWHQPPGRER